MIIDHFVADSLECNFRKMTTLRTEGIGEVSEFHLKAKDEDKVNVSDLLKVVKGE